MSGGAGIWPLPPRQVLRWGFAITGVVAATSWLVDVTYPGGWRYRLDVDAEGSIPAWMSSTALAGCALVMISLWRRDDPPLRRYWLGLGVIFTGLSLDEAIALHEAAIDPLQRALDTSGPLFYAWIIPGFAFVIAVALVYVPFLRRVEQTTARLLLLAGALYVGGAAGMEMLSGMVATDGRESVLFTTLATVEEVLEMAGITVLLATLARHDSLAAQPAAVARGSRARHDELAGHPR